VHLDLVSTETNQTPGTGDWDYTLRSDANGGHAAESVAWRIAALGACHLAAQLEESNELRLPTRDRHTVNYYALAQHAREGLACCQHKNTGDEVLYGQNGPMTSATYCPVRTTCV
jgi:hypothetical protein